MPATPENQSLRSQKVLITRPQQQNQSLAQKLVKLGAHPVLHPVIRISQPKNMQAVSDCMGRIREFEAVVLLSRNAGNSFVAALENQANTDSEATIPAIIAIGQGTKSCLEEAGFTDIQIPDKANSESMAEFLIHQSKTHSWTRPVLILRADRGSDVLPNALVGANIPFEELAIYRSENVSAADTAVRDALLAGEIDWVTVTSSAIAQNVAKLFAGCLEQTKVVSISPQTTSAATEAGLKVHAEAKQYNMDGLVAAMITSQSEDS